MKQRMLLKTQAQQGGNTANPRRTQRTRKPQGLIGLAFIGLGSLAIATYAPAAGAYWNGTTNNLWGTNNWSSTAAGLDQMALGAGADVYFSVTSAPANQNTLLDSNTTISSLTVNDTTGVTIGGLNTLTLAPTGLVTGINVNAGAGLTTISSNLVLGNLSQIVTVNNAAGMLVSGVIGGTHGLTKAGTGVLTLTGNEAYTGATVVAGGALQLGDGVTPGASIASSNSVLIASGASVVLNLRNNETFGNSVTNNGQVQWSQTGTSYQATTSVISGTGSMYINAPGTTVLLGNNTYSGGTTINTTGDVLVGNAISNTSTPYGSGVLTINNGYVDTENSQLLQIGVGGYDQTGGEIGMHLQGTTLGSYTRYNVAGTSNLSGGTVFAYDLSGNYVPYGGWMGNPAGDVQNIIHTSGGLSGQFASNAPDSLIYNAKFNEFFRYSQGATLLYPTVTYDPANANITWVQDSFTSVPGLTPNQIAMGTALDTYQNQNPVDPGGVITYLDGQNIATLPDLYNSLMPADLTAIFQIGFAGAEMQNSSIERHLDLVRQTPSGYTTTSPSTRTQDSKGHIMETPGMTTTEGSNRWSLWVEGSGEFASVDGDDNAFGYDFDTYRGTLGADLRVNDNFAVGILGGYGDANAELNRNGSIDMESGKAAIYATAFNENFYLDALIGGGFNSYETHRPGVLGYADGEVDGWELNSLLNAGYDIHQGALTYGLTASASYTKVELDSFTETGSLLPLRFPEQSQESLRSNLGARLSYTAVMNGIKVIPQVRAAWQHEFLDDTQSMSSQFATGNSPVFTVNGPEMGNDSAIVSAGLTVQFTPALSIYSFYDGQVGRSNYISNNVSCGLKFDF